MAFIMVAVVSCGGAEERKLTHFQRGVASFKEGHFKKARIELKNALQIAPKDITVRYWYAQSLVKDKKWREAVAQYRKIIGLDGHHTDARIQLGQLYFVSSSLDRALVQAENVLQTDAAHPDALVLRGAIRAGLGDIQGAIEDGRTAMTSVPEHVNSLVLVSSLYLDQERFDEALALVVRGVNSNPGHRTLRLIEAKIHQAGGDLGRAIEVLRAMVDDEPGELSRWLHLADFCIAQGKLDKAEEVLRSALAQVGDDPGIMLALVEFLASYRDNALAEQTLRGFIEQRQDPDHTLRFSLAALYERTGKLRRARAVYKEIIGLAGDSAKGLHARNQLANSLLVEQKYNSAMRLVEHVLEKNKNDIGARMTRGRIAIATNDPAAAIADFRSVLSKYPDSIEVLLLSATAHQASDEWELAGALLRKAVARDPKNLAARSSLIESLVKAGNTVQAIAQLQQLLVVAPKNASALDTLHKLQSANQDRRAAIKAAERIKDEFPVKPIAFKQASWGYREGRDYEAGLERFLIAVPKSVDADIGPVARMIRKYMVQDEVSAAVPRLDAILRKDPKNYIAKNMIGELLLGQQRYDAAAKAFEQVVVLEPNWDLPYHRLAKIYSLQQKLELAADAYQRGLMAIPADIMLTIGLGNLYEELGRYDQAIDLYEQVLSYAPDQLVAANNLAMLLVEYKADRAALDRAKSIVERLKASQNPLFLDTIGWVEYKAGDLDTAAAFLEKALVLTPDSPEFRYHLGMVYLGRGETHQAHDQLRLALDHGKRFRGMDQAKAVLNQL